MSGVDALALLRDPHYDLRSAEEFRDAAAAVTELIEAAEHVLATSGVNAAYRVRVAAHSGLRAALARCRGGES